MVVELREKSETVEVPPRIERLRERAINAKYALCLEASQAMTEVHKEMPEKPMAIKCAESLRRACQKKTICIYDDELIVGTPGYKRKAMPYLINASTWLKDELDTVSTRQWDPMEITEEQKRVFLKELYPFWKGKTLHEHIYSRYPQSWLEMEQAGVVTMIGRSISPGGSAAYDYPALVRTGFKGIEAHAKAKLASLDRASPEDFSKVTFLEAVIIVCNGMATLGKRHAEVARKMARQETRPERKAELEKIAEICDWVPYNPPRTFWEALQAVWFAQMCMWIDAGGAGHSISRIDRFLYPFYKKDIEEGRLTKEQAQELLDCFFVKLGEVKWVMNELTAKYAGGGTPGQNICVSGLDENGKDDTTELSYMCIQATMDTRLPQPSLTVNWHKTMPADLQMKACELIRMGTGHPAILNNEVGQKMMLSKGASLKDAQNFVIMGCVEGVIQGKMHQWGYISQYSMPAGVEFVLNNGKHVLSGKQFGLQTGDPDSFKSFEEFKEAVKKQVAYLIKHTVMRALIIEEETKQLFPRILGSALLQDCIDRGRDMENGGAHYHFGSAIIGIGCADVADSLAAIKKLVFEEKKLTMAQLREALNHNFEGDGYGEVHRMLMSVPKYGNDDDYVDLIFKEWMSFIAQQITSYTDSWGAPYNSSVASFTRNVTFGKHTGALPSGRKAGTPFADNVSPKQGWDTKGCTAVARSLGKVNWAEHRIACILNQKIEPWALEGDRGLRNLASWIRTYHDLGGWHVQINVVSPETLKDAQAHPERHKGLLVRVSGYTVYFTQLAKEVQDDIIARTSQTKI